jgi:hypothetical protein
MGCVIDDLAVALDGSTSTDPDGTIASYRWDLGDGAIGWGDRLSHTYASAGTRTVQLTVTDDRGATATTSQAVTVTEPEPEPTVTEPAPEPAATEEDAPSGAIAGSDRFERSVTGGLGTADLGGRWSTAGSTTRYSVVDGRGRHQMAAPGTQTQSLLNEVATSDVVATVDLALDAAPTGGGVYSSVAVRRTGTSHYEARVRAMPSGTTLTLTRLVDGVGTQLRAVNVPGLVYSSGDVLRLRVEAIGSGTTSLGAKVWRLGEAEPSEWQATATDSAAALQGSGGVGLANYLSGASGTVAPLTVLYDDLVVIDPSNSPTEDAAGGERSVAGFVHPGVVVSGEQLDFVKAKVAAGAQPWAGALERVQRNGYASLSYRPGAVPVIQAPSRGTRHGSRPTRSMGTRRSVTRSTSMTLVRPTRMRCSGTTRGTGRMRTRRSRS